MIPQDNGNSSLQENTNAQGQRVERKAFALTPQIGTLPRQVRVHLMLSRGASLARPVLWLAVFTKPQETRRIVVKDVAFLHVG